MKLSKIASSCVGLVALSAMSMACNLSDQVSRPAERCVEGQRQGQEVCVDGRWVLESVDMTGGVDMRPDQDAQDQGATPKDMGQMSDMADMRDDMSGVDMSDMSALDMSDMGAEEMGVQDMTPDMAPACQCMPAQACLLGACVDATKIVSPEQTKELAFGSSIAVDGQWMAVGAPLLNSTTFNSPGGRVFIFERGRSGAWTLKQTLQSKPNGTGNFAAGFGSSVALRGGRLVVGSPQESNAVFSRNEDGGAYVYSVDLAGRWTLNSRFPEGNPQSNSRYGAAVATDGATILFGVPFQDIDGKSNAGKVVKTTCRADVCSTATTDLEGVVGARERAQVGSALALLSPTSAAFGAPNDSTTLSTAGSVRIWGDLSSTAAGALYLEPAELTSGERFGSALASDQRWLAVGAPRRKVGNEDRSGRVYVYDAQNLSAAPIALEGAMPANDQELGSAVDVAAAQLVVGAPGASSGAGQVTVYEHTAAGWVVRSVLDPTMSSNREINFGAAVALDPRGQVLVVGAPLANGRVSGAGEIYIYQ